MSMRQKIFRLLCAPTLLHYVLPVIMAYLVIGTVAQKYIGLYRATHLFFLDPVLWFGPLPLPGMPVLMGLVFINLTFKLIYKSPWTIRNAGIIITHIGVMVLLLGGLFTALFSHEGYIALGQGEQKNVVSDYHIREFVIFGNDETPITTYAHGALETHRRLPLENLPFEIEILEHCKNCEIVARENPDEQHQGMAQHMQLRSAQPRNNDEENMAGLTFQVKGKETENIFVVLEDVPQYPTISIDEKIYRFALTRQQRPLPFSVTLLDFKKELHPNTEIAKSYQSTVLIEDGDLRWESTISMNEPLRYKGYTFFQSSFVETPQGPLSVLAVVWNIGRAFPYISGLVLSIGMIAHIILRNKPMKRKQA